MHFPDKEEIVGASPTCRTLEETMKFFRVSVLIDSTRQSMSGYIFADTEESARKIFHRILPVAKNVVVDEIGMEESFVTMTQNDREVQLKYFPRKE